MKTRKVKPMKNRTNVPTIYSYALLLLFTVSFSAPAENDNPPDAIQGFPNNVYWGDTHLHTSLSVDAYGSGGRLESDVAYRFAKGEPVTLQNGMQLHIHRPLDFLIVADHAENMSVSQAMANGDIRHLNQSLLKEWMQELKEEKEIDWANLDEAGEQVSRAFRRWGWGNKKMVLDKDTSSATFSNNYLRWAWGDAIGNKAFRQSVWEQVTSRADEYNEPGKFTALIGYEWSPLFPYPQVRIEGSR